MKKLLLVFTLVALVVPATASAKSRGGAQKSPAKYCKALRAELGAEAFRAAFGNKQGRNAHGRCVAKQRKARRDARKKARKACRAQGFRGRALKRCLRKKLATAPAAPKPAEYKAIAEECRAEQAEDPEGFAEEYGDGEAAIGRCAAERVEEDSGEDELDEDEDFEEDPDSEDPEDVLDEEPVPDDPFL